MDSTSLPSVTASKYFYWPSCELTRPLTASTADVTAYWSVVPRDEDGVALTGGFLTGITNRSGKTETVWVALSAVAADGLSATVVRGIDIMGPDYTVGDSDFVYALESGSPVFCVISPNMQNIVIQTIQGSIATGANQFRVGDQTAGNKTYGIDVDGTFKGIVRGNGTTSQFSNDGTTWTSFSDAVASVIVKVSSADTTAGYLNDKIDVATAGRLTKSIGNPAANETIRLTLATTSTDAELNKLTGASANVTAANLNTLTAGAASNADALHTHATIDVVSYTAYEAITADDAVAVLPVETQWYTQLTDTVVNVGSLNSLRRRAVKYIPTATGTLTNWNFRAAEQVNGATTLGDLIITIETDTAGAPSGTALTNATATISQVTQRTWNTTMGTRLATFAGSVSFTAGTTYWVVYAVSATDAANYLKFGANDTYVNNYLTFTSQIYNLDTASWGSSSTTSIPFGWSNTTIVPFGYAVVPTDSNFGTRTWNFKGFAQSTVAAQAAVNVETTIANLTGLIPDRNPYYLSSTPGLITQTAPQSFYNAGSPSEYSYKVGQATSTTSFQVDPGEKFIWGSLAISSTTTTQILTWFRPKTVRLSGGMNTAADQTQSSQGIYDGTNNSSSYVNDEIGGRANKSSGISTGSSFGAVVGDNGFTGAGGSLTSVGFAYTLTETGTMTANLIWQASTN